MPVPGHLTNIHPGNILKEDYLPDLHAQGLTRYALAKSLKLTQSQFDELLAGKRNITANIALRLGRLFEQNPRFWLGLQNNYDLKLAELRYGQEIESIRPITQSTTNS